MNKGISGISNTVAGDRQNFFFFKYVNSNSLMAADNSIGQKLHIICCRINFEQKRKVELRRENQYTVIIFLKKIRVRSRRMPSTFPSSL